MEKIEDNQLPSDLLDHPRHPLLREKWVGLGNKCAFEKEFSMMGEFNNFVIEDERVEKAEFLCTVQEAVKIRVAKDKKYTYYRFVTGTNSIFAAAWKEEDPVEEAASEVTGDIKSESEEMYIELLKNGRDGFKPLKLERGPLGRSVILSLTEESYLICEKEGGMKDYVWLAKLITTGRLDLETKNVLNKLDGQVAGSLNSIQIYAEECLLGLKSLHRNDARISRCYLTGEAWDLIAKNEAGHIILQKNDLGCINSVVPSFNCSFDIFLEDKTTILVQDGRTSYTDAEDEVLKHYCYTDEAAIMVACENGETWPIDLGLASYVYTNFVSS